MRAQEFILEAQDTRITAMQTAMRHAGATNADGTPLTVDGAIGTNTQAAMRDPRFAQFVPADLRQGTRSGPHPMAPAVTPPAVTPPAVTPGTNPNIDNTSRVKAAQQIKGTEHVDPRDGSITIGDKKRVGGHINWRANNPGNNMFSDLAKQFGAVGYIRAGDKEPVAIMPSMDAGIKLQMAQWRSPKYNNGTIDQGCQLWAVANRGIRGTDYARDLAHAAGATIDTPVKDLTDAQLSKMCAKQGHWEGGPNTVQVVAANTPATPAVAESWTGELTRYQQLAAVKS